MVAADIGYFVRVMNENESSAASSKSTVLITRDLLGGSSTLDSKELDLDLQVPSGWEKRLDLKSGKVYLQKCNTLNSQSEHKHHQMNNRDTDTKQLQDLNFPPISKQPLNLFNETNLDLKLVPSSQLSSGYQSVCTLDKVKFALERAEKQSTKKRPMSVSNSTSQHSNSSSSVKEMPEVENESSSSSYAAGCPSCLLYVLISKNNPRCPRCNTIVPSPTTVALKKPRIDLNF